jgi:DNA sulfur modification protein DndB
MGIEMTLKKTSASYVLPAITGNMGSTHYYQAVMRADELSALVHAAMDFEEFDSVLASERMQRELSESRVEQQIVPYLTNSPDRFFGSMIVLVYQPELFEFEPLSSFGFDAGASHRGSAKQMGFLTISGGRLFALDGQHRLHALRTVITQSRTPRLNLKIEGPYRQDVPSDMLSVIFVPFESVEKARRIFNKVNRYAKPTTKATNILMSEDDGHAIIARCIASLDDPGKFDSDIEPPIPSKLSNGHETVNYLQPSLNGKDAHLLTLELIHKSIGSITSATGFPPLEEAKTIVRPDDELLRQAYEECARWWSKLISDFSPFVAALRSPSLIPDMRNLHGDFSLALRPIGQEALIAAMMRAHKMTKKGPAALIQALNKIDWGFGNDSWVGVFLGGGEKRNKIITKRLALGTELITYLLVGPDLFGAAATTRLRRDFLDAQAEYGWEGTKLPRHV